MSEELKPGRPRPGTLHTEEATDEITNDSLGTVDPADTSDTDPDDDKEARKNLETPGENKGVETD
jgi:hypothetical protein